MDAELKDLAINLIAYCQRHDLLPTDGEVLFETLQDLSPETSAGMLIDLIEG